MSFRTESIVSMLIINLSLLGANIPFFFRIGAPIFVLAIMLAVFLMDFKGYRTMTGKRILHTVFLTVPCVVAASTDPLPSLWLRISGVVASLVFTFVSYHYIDNNCTIDFKNECWKGVLADFSLITVIGMSITLYFKASFWVFLVIYLVSLLYAYYLTVDFSVSGPTRVNLTNNDEQRTLFGINDNDI